MPKANKQTQEGSNLVVSLREAARICYENFGRGIILYMPGKISLYVISPDEFLEEKDYEVLKQYDPEKELILSMCTGDGRVEGDITVAPFITGIIEFEKEICSLTLELPSLFGAESQGQVEEKRRNKATLN